MDTRSLVNWKKKFEDVGAFWRHDQNPLRPYARLTSGRISDGFFDADRVTAHPSLVYQAIGHLMQASELERALRLIRTPEECALRKHAVASTLNDLRPSYVEERRGPRITLVVGAAYGAITPAYAAAHHAEARMAFAVKREDGTFTFDRFEASIGEQEVVLIIEDTVTTGGTVRKIRDALIRIRPKSRFIPCVLSFCNRSNTIAIDDMEIASLISPDIRSWKEGENPYTPDGRELVPPVSEPKLHSHELTRTYP